MISFGGRLDAENLGKLLAIRCWFASLRSWRFSNGLALVITHAGINTVLESLSAGVPLVAVLLGNDQPGVAARIKAHGAGLVVPLRKLNSNRLRNAVEQVLQDSKYREAAGALQRAIRQLDGPGLAADLVEQAAEYRLHTTDRVMRAILSPTYSNDRTRTIRTMGGAKKARRIFCDGPIPLAHCFSKNDRL